MQVEAIVPVRVVVEVSDTDPLRCGHCKYYSLQQTCKLYKSLIHDRLRRPGCVKDVPLDKARDAIVPDAHWHLYKNHGLTDAQLADIVALGDVVHQYEKRHELAAKWQAAGARPKQSFGIGDVWYYGYGNSKPNGGYVYSVPSHD